MEICAHELVHSFAVTDCSHTGTIHDPMVMCHMNNSFSVVSTNWWSDGIADLWHNPGDISEPDLYVIRRAEEW